MTYAGAALPTAGIAPPAKFITADMVTKGKPHPEPYIAGASAIGADVKECESPVLFKSVAEPRYRH